MTLKFEKIKRFLIGKPRNPMKSETRRHIALIAFLAWIGLGADGLSSSCYGPEQSFYALGEHTHLAIYLALATAITVFLISLAYNQVIRLFPNGGGGYKVASKLLGPRAGLVSGAALIIDYVLMIAISIAAGMDALFSLLPVSYQPYKLVAEPLILLLLVMINLRGVKESIKILMTIFLGFFVTHILIITVGIALHSNHLHDVFSNSVTQTQHSAQLLGWSFMIALFLRAYSLGGGTYTGLEAVSDNVQILAEPRIKTGFWTMLYMAISLSVTAGGIILLYLLWNAHAVPGQTLNAVAFTAILTNSAHPQGYLFILLVFEAGILFVAANTGFLGGPAVLAYMSMDSWVPSRFGMLSSRLVTQNGIFFFGLAALIILLATKGRVEFLVILYSMNVFLAFTMTMLGLIAYWFRHRTVEKGWLLHLLMSCIAFVVCAFILMVTLYSKFKLGGWITVLITSAVIGCCIIIKRHYNRFNALKKKLNQDLSVPIDSQVKKTAELDPKKPTAVFFVKELGAAIHCLLWVNRMFPNYFHNFVFVSAGEVDMGSFGSDEALKKLKGKTDGTLDYLVKYSEMQGLAPDSYSGYGTDVVEELMKIADIINKKFPNALYFSSRYVYPNENWFTRLLHSNLVNIIERRLHAVNSKMLILPLQLET